jgi:uncharacterized membrane protein (DUF4010 family)
MPASMDREIRRAAVAITAVAFALVAAITASFDYSRAGELQFTTDVAWITAIDAGSRSGWTGSRCRCSS